MIQNTFVHIPGITKNAEIKLWRNNIRDWQSLIEHPEHVQRTRQASAIKYAQDSLDAIKTKNYPFFSTLPKNQHWRMYNLLQDRTCYLDIETTGLSSHHDDITLIGIHGCGETKIFMKDKNLDKFAAELRKYDNVVTFNGKCFDIPFIVHKFSSMNIPVSIPIYHTDLRYVMADLGFRGGLKSIERQRGICRDEEIENFSGFDAVVLWRRYERGDNDALRKLKKYLCADVENLPLLMKNACIEMKQKHFIDKLK